MKITRLIAAALAGSALALGAGVSIAQQAGKAPKGNFGIMVSENDGGHLIGNPAAETKLVEYVSYTCSHCATFTQQGEGAIKLAYVPTGKVSLEIRHFLRDPIDLTAAMLTHCGDAKKFPANHTAIMHKQADWMQAARNTTQAQRARWQFGSNASRRQAIASDLGFDDIMANRGYSRVDINRCLADDGKAQALAQTSVRDIAAYKLEGTPTFLINGKVLEGVHSWAALQPALDARF